MSVQASAWAWKTTTGSSGQRLVLLALADTANDTGECWPGVDHLAEKTGLSVRQVRYHLDALEGLGLLTRKRRRRPDGSMGTYRYQLAMTSGHPRPVDQRQSIASGSPLPVATDCSPSGNPLPVDQRQSIAAQNRHYRTTSEPSENTLSPFDAFWNAFPRKVGKPTAQRAYNQHVDDHTAVMAGLTAWNTYWATLDSQQFVPHPTTWLNRHGWLDQPPAPTRRRPAGTIQTTVDTARQVLEQYATDIPQLEAGDQ